MLGDTTNPSCASDATLPTPYKLQALVVLQAPVPGWQLPGWQPSAPGHDTGCCPTHMPAKHTSVLVQALLSLQAVPSPAVGFVHTPVIGSQLPAT